MNESPRNFKNPWPRMAFACLLTIWAGANLWSVLFRWNDIWDTDVASRSVGLLFAILLSVLPLVIAIYLFWSIVVGPNDPTLNAKEQGTKRTD